MITRLIFIVSQPIKLVVVVVDDDANVVIVIIVVAVADFVFVNLVFFVFFIAVVVDPRNRPVKFRSVIHVVLLFLLLFMLLFLLLLLLLLPETYL